MMLKKKKKTHEKCGGFKLLWLQSRGMKESEREREIRKKNERESVMRKENGKSEREREIV